VLAQLSQRHAIFMMDLASAVSSPNHFATNGNAFCSPTPIVPSAGSSAAIESAMRAEYAQIQAKVLSLSSTTIGGNPAVKSVLQLTSTAGQTVTENQFAVLAKDSRLCTVTLTTDRPSALQKTFNVIGNSIQAG
jgi:hypothetical protein